MGSIVRTVNIIDSEGTVFASLTVPYTLTNSLIMTPVWIGQVLANNDYKYLSGALETPDCPYMIEIINNETNERRTICKFR